MYWRRKSEIRWWKGICMRLNDDENYQLEEKLRQY
jgi:hypothetical protein